MRLIIRFALMTATISLPAYAQAQAQQQLEAGAGPGATPIANCDTDLRYLNSVTGWQVVWPREWAMLDSVPANRRAQFIERWSTGPAALDRAIAELRKGRGTSAAAPEAAVRRVLSEVEALQSSIDTEAFAGDGWKSDPYGNAVATALKAAIERYRKFVADEYLPLSSRNAGLPATAAGERCFLSAAEWWTGLALSTEDIERAGRDLLARTNAELDRTAGISAGQRRAFLDRLRSASSFGRTTDRDILDASRAAIDRASRHLDGWFQLPSSMPVDVRAMSAAMAANAPAGLYRPGKDGANGIYEVNTSRPAERRLMAEVIAFHETLPGHHLAAVASQGAGGFNVGFGEGWGVYAEYLADEMGLYSTGTDRIGMIAKHLWAASRLVVEPGLHVHGWSREQAIDFMLDHTALSRSEIEIEVDRYISMPGQSLSYMLGYQRIDAMRRRAEQALGPKFSLPQFHQTILAKGMRDLDDVDQDVTDWIGRVREGVADGSR